MAPHAAERVQRFELVLLRCQATRLREEVQRRLVRWANVAATLDYICADRDLPDPLIAEAFVLRTALDADIRRFARTLAVLHAALGSKEAE
jgi:hypothetical protein